MAAPLLYTPYDPNKMLSSIAKQPIVPNSRPTSTTSKLRKQPNKMNAGNQMPPIPPVAGSPESFLPGGPKPITPIKVPGVGNQNNIQTLISGKNNNVPLPGTINSPLPGGTPPTTTPPQPTSPISQSPTDLSQYTTPINYNPNANEADQYMQLKMSALNKSGQQQQQSIFDEYKNTLGDLNFQKAIESGKYTNANDVYGGIEKVRGQFQQGVSDPLMIQRNTGLPQETINRILKGEGYKDLQLNPSYAQEQGKPFEQAMADTTLERNRNIEDFNLKADQTQQNANQTIQDMIDQTNLSVIAAQKMGALTGQGMSSGYQQGLLNIQDQNAKLVARIKENVKTDNADIMKIKGRMLEDYQTNMTRLKDKYDTSMNNLRIQGLSNLQEIDSKFGMSSEKTKKALLDLYNNLDTSRANILADTIKLKTQLIDLKQKEQDQIDKMNEIKKIGDYYFQGNKPISESQIQDMVAQGDISSSQIGTKNVTLRTPALTALQSANEALNAAGLGNLGLGSEATASTRDQTQTIAGMAKKFGIAFDSTNPNKTAAALRATGHQVADVGKSQHEKGLAIDVLSPDKSQYSDQDYIQKVKPYLEAQGWKRMNIPGDAGHFEFKGTTTQEGGQLDELDYYNAVIPNIPLQLRSSDKEQARLQEGIEKYRQKGLSPQESAYKFLGFNISNKKDYPFADTLLSLVSSSGVEKIPADIYKRMSNAVNSKNYGGAIRLAENTIYNGIKGDYVREDTASIATQRANELLNLVNQYQGSFGPISGTISSFLTRSFGNKEQANLQTKIKTSISAMRNQLAGSAVTQYEGTYLNDIIPSMTDPAENAIEKIKQLKTDPLLQLNQTRRVNGLPPLNEDQLLNASKRVSLYQEGGQDQGGNGGIDLSNFDISKRFK